MIVAWMTLLALVFASAGASARTDVDTKPHVEAIDVVAATCIEVHGLASAEEHQGILRLATTETSDVPDAARGGAEALKVGRFRLTETVAKHATDVVKRGPFKGELARPFLKSPHTIEQIIKTGKGVPDPGGVAGALRYDVPGAFRGSQGTWELVVKGDQILHFNFVR